MDLHFVIYTAKKIMKWTGRIFYAHFYYSPVFLFDKNFLFLKHLIYFLVPLHPINY